MKDSLKTNQDEDKPDVGFSKHLSFFFLAAVVIVFFVATIIRFDDLGERSIWADEAWVALKVSQPAMADVLIDKSNRHYSYPPFFGVSVHLFTRVLGNGEAALRLFPCLCGVLSLLLIFLITRMLAGKFSALFSMFLLGFSPIAYLYSRELKQYSSDIFFALLLTFLSLLLVEKFSIRRWLLFAACCILGIWFSQTLLFFLPGSLLFVLLYSLQNKSKKDILLSFSTGLAVLVSFGILYALFITKQRHQGLPEYWQDLFADTSSIGAFFSWSLIQFSNLFDYLFLPQNKWSGLVLIVFGIAWWISKSRATLLLVLLPVPLVYMASIFGQYPFGGSRTLIFLLPFLIIGAAQGARGAWNFLPLNFHRKDNVEKGENSVANLTVKTAYKFFVGGMLFTFAITWFLPTFKFAFVAPYKLEESRPVIRNIEKNLSPEDRIYVYPYGTDVFDYYYRGEPSIVTYGKPSRDNPAGYYEDIENFIVHQGRFWFFFTHFRAGKTNELEVFFNYLQKRCKIAKGFQEQDAAAMLALCPKVKTSPANETVE